MSSQAILRSGGAGGAASSIIEHAYVRTKQEFQSCATTFHRCAFAAFVVELCLPLTLDTPPALARATAPPGCHAQVRAPSPRRAASDPPPPTTHRRHQQVHPENFG